MKSIQTTKNANNNAFMDRVRSVQGGAVINFFAGLADTAATIVEMDDNTASTTHSVTLENAKQIFQPNIELEKTLTSLDGVYDPNGNLLGVGIPLDGSARFIDQNTNTGWVGDTRSDTECNFDSQNPQRIVVAFQAPRRVPKLFLEGLDKNNYPIDFEIDLLDDKENILHTIYPQDKINIDIQQEIYQYNFDLDSIPILENTLVMYLILKIYKWSRALVLPRIKTFVGQMYEGFDSSNIQSIEIVEEKTANIEELSSNLSSNLCKTIFVNRNKKFYQKDYYDMLKVNRSIECFVYCGQKIDKTKLDIQTLQQYKLGRYYSSEWNLQDGSSFMSVSGYDILYSLQSVSINYGVEIIENPTTQLVTYKDQSIQEVLQRIFALLETKRRNSGLFDKIEMDIQMLDPLLQIRIPSILIEEESVWDILQSIANLYCTYIFVDREGKIVISSDSRTSASISHLAQSITKQKLARESSNGYEIQEVQFVVEDEDSIAINGVQEYEYDARLFAIPDNGSGVPTELLAMGQGILDKYSKGIGYVETEWIGNAELQVGDEFMAKSMYDDYKIYEVMSSEITINQRGFRQTIKGREVLESTFSPEELIKINPSNAFSFSLPVKSRTIVNRVIGTYSLLVPLDDEEKEEISIQKRDCKIRQEIEIVDGVEVVRYKVNATVKLGRVYDRIENIKIEVTETKENVDVYKIVTASYNSIALEFYVADTNFKEIKFTINAIQNEQRG